jgi:hypothetical protein
MRYMPDGVHREHVSEEWYVIWLGLPHAEGSVVIGRTKRLRRHLYHRCFPESGAACEDVRGHVAGIEWLLRQHRARSD